MPVETEQDKEGRRRAWAVATSVGSELAGIVLVCVGIGYWLDKRYSTSPWGTLIGTLFGISYGLFRLVRAVSRP
jgi:F0F1-type ATP synthase assembly protein I